MTPSAQNLKVLFLASEATPLVKVGGLADVAGALPAALLKCTHNIDIRVMLPFHGKIDRSRLKVEPVTTVAVPYGNGLIGGQVFETKVKGVKFYLVSGEPILPGAPVYTSDAAVDGIKYTFFSLAALNFVRKINWIPHIIHAHDWHTAPAIYALRVKRFPNSFFENTASLLTVHNLPYLGVGAHTALQDFGLPPNRSGSLPEWASHMPLPLGLLTADHINTVSPTYAQEILTPEFGSGLEEFLRGRRDKISGILNGLDMINWDPSSDPALATNYTIGNLPERRQNKSRLQKEVSLDENERTPLLAMITRLDNQKGVDLAIDALHKIAHLSWQTVILGTGDPELEKKALQLEQDLPTKVRAIIQFDAKLARRIYGGADVIFVPSRYEPCGLTQMIGMRYGCVPIVRAVGGLRDTVKDYKAKNGTGFVFEEASGDSLARATIRTFDVYSDQRRWRGMQLRGMKKDFSWRISAEKYYELYKKLATLKKH
jgi:starch synthase